MFKNCFFFHYKNTFVYFRKCIPFFPFSSKESTLTSHMMMKWQNMAVKYIHLTRGEI